MSDPVGARNSDVGVDQARQRPILRGVYRILYRFLASLARLAVRSGCSKDIEMATQNPTGAWTTQAARNLLLSQVAASRALVRDRGSQFIDTFAS